MDASVDGRKRTHKVRSLLDGLIVAMAFASLSWTLVIGPVWHSTDLSTIGGLVDIAYPFGDAVILVFVVTAVRRMTKGDRRPLWILLGGLLLMALSDSAYTYLTTTQSYATGNLIDVGWIAAYLVIGLAAFSSEAPRAAAIRASANDGPTLAGFLAPVVPALLALGVAALQLQVGHPLDTAATAGALALVALVLTRQTLLVREILSGADTSDAHRIRELLDVALGRSPSSHALPPAPNSPFGSGKAPQP